MSNPENRPLRLTLRTLLAWLDDQLAPADVREIGQKVAESPVAQGLIERIQKVTRRRRLTVPTSTGPDGTDPNLVASYLDNQLPPDKVAEYEEKCLKSDLDLAEVASCHQILSMIGQRAKVPPEARFRMYRLIRGREAIAREGHRAFAPLPAEPAAKPIPQWTPAGGARRRSLLERLGPPAAVVVLMLLMGISAWMMLPDEQHPPAEDAQAKADEGIAPGAGMVAPGLGQVPVQPALPSAPGGMGLPPAVPGVALGQEPDAGETAAPGGVEASQAEPEAGDDTPEVTTPPDGAVASVADLGDGVLLRWDPDQRTWVLLEESAELDGDDRIVAPEPFRPVLQLGPAQVRLIGPAEVQTLRPTEGEAGRLALAQGRVVLLGTSATTATVLLEGQAVTIDPPAEVPVGVQRVDNWPAGAAEPSAPSLVLYAPEGQVSLRAGAAAATLAGPGSITFRLPARFTEATPAAMPDWVLREEPPEADLLTGQAFAAYFGPDVSTARALVEAIEDSSASVRRLAVSSLGTLGAIDLVAAALTRSEDPATRRAAIRALREYGARSPMAARDLRNRLARFNGTPWAEVVTRLLAGYTPEQARQRATYAELVGLLEHPDVGVRELALNQLMSLTGRDALQYSPDTPTGAGLEAWKELLRRDEIQPRGPLEAAPEDAEAPPGA